MRPTSRLFETRPFAAAGRRAISGEVLSPDLVFISKDGVLHHFNPTDRTTASETFDLPELRDTNVVHVTASAQDPKAGAERLVVTIAAVGSKHNWVFLVLQRTSDGWRRIDLQHQLNGPIETKDLVLATSTGFASLAYGKAQTFYALLESRILSVYTLGFDNVGGVLICALTDNPRGIDMVATPAMTEEFSLARIEGNRLSFYPPIRPINPQDIYKGGVHIAFNYGQPSAVFTLPGAPDFPDGSCMTPITDSLHYCRGMLVRTVHDDLYVAAFADAPRRQSVGVLSGHANGPAKVRQVRCAVYHQRDFHIFAVDEQERIWYANWPSGAQPEKLVWDSTGQTGRFIDAPQLMTETPFLFEQRDATSVDRIEQAGFSEPWTRTSIHLPALANR